MTTVLARSAVSRDAEDVEDLAAQAQSFVIESCIPEEEAWRASGKAVSDELRWALIDKARDAGLFAPHVPAAYGGRDLDHRGRAKVFEAAGYSLLGPMALHCAAPDEGNQHLLSVVAAGTQREEYLKPLC